MAARAHQGERPTGEDMRDAQGTGPDDRSCGWEEAFAELTLLLPNRQMEGAGKGGFASRTDDGAIAPSPDP